MADFAGYEYKDSGLLFLKSSLLYLFRSRNRHGAAQGRYLLKLSILKRRTQHEESLRAAQKLQEI